MSDKRDMLDELIDIRQDWAALSNPLSTITKVMTGQAERPAPYNPSDYKERPRVNSMFCLNVCAASTEKNDDIPLPTTTTCSACMAVCPVDAITIEGTTVRVSDDCRMCGLCTMVCPTETFLVQRLMAKSLYDSIARAASMFETCYVTCTRALGRKPYDNEIVLPCVGAVPRDVWIALLAEYSNISVFLPLGICDRCKNSANGEWGDMIQMGVLDPVKVTRVTLQNASSVASLILITEATISDEPKDTSIEEAISRAASAGNQGGMY